LSDFLDRPVRNPIVCNIEFPECASENPFSATC
jgi:hypothetical protein